MRKIDCVEYGTLVFQLKRELWTDFTKCFPFDCIISIARGGFYLGDTLSREFKRPLGLIFHQSYRDHNEKIENNIVSDLISGVPLNGNALLVDDLADTGKTLHLVKEKLLEKNKFKCIKTATFFKKNKSIITPDFYVYDVPEKEWIQFSYEQGR